MPSTRTELQKQAQNLLLQYAFFRWENAVVIAGTLLLSVLLPRPFPGWPIWGWLLLGLLGVAAIVYSSLTDADANARILLQLMQEQFNPRAIRDPDLRKSVENALEYQRRIEDLIRGQRPGIMRDRLEETATQLSDWVSNVYKLAQRLDAYKQDGLLRRERESVPQEVENLKARIERESDPALRRQVTEVLAGKQQHLQALHALEGRMSQARLQMEQSLTALATIYSQVRLVDAQDISSGRAERLRADIQEQVDRLNDLVTSINEVYDYHSEGLG